MPSSYRADKEIQGLIELIGNTLDSYTTALFLAPQPGQPLQMAAHLSLSQHILPQVRIASGEGLVGWAYKNKKTINIAKFDQDTRRLLFYGSDEDIKSFLAVPLSDTPGVLVADSKQRYIFTDKLQKIFFGFAQVIEQAVGRMQEVDKGRRRAEALTFLNRLEGILFRRDQAGQYLQQSAALLRGYVRSDACFVARVLPEERDRYHLVAHDLNRPYRIQRELFNADEGLMGWVMREKKALFLQRARLDTDKSYIFYPDEPFREFTAFAGLPLIRSGRLQGAVCFAGRDAFDIEEVLAQGLEMAADRLAAALESEYLIHRLAEVGRLDPQTGLLHRSGFCQRIAEVISAFPAPMFLLVVRLRNLDDILLSLGQDAADETMKQAAQALHAHTADDIELGRLGHDTFGLLVAGRGETEVRQIGRELLEALQKLNPDPKHHRLRLDVKIHATFSSTGAPRAEELVTRGLAAVQDRPAAAGTSGGQ
jgi:signal transduction protein with GAF and PtsI domain